MSLLAFVDDDKKERKDLGKIVKKAGYKYRPIAWPPSSGQHIEKLVKKPPDLFVLDLYLPPRDGSALETISEKECVRQRKLAKRVSDCFFRLYEGPCVGREKELLRDTMSCLRKARKLLDAQWKAIGQSPDNGLALLARIRTHYPGLPVVFYSRKITPEDVVCVLRAGAVDAIRKGSLSPEALVRRFKRAECAPRMPITNPKTL